MTASGLMADRDNPESPAAPGSAGTDRQWVCSALRRFERPLVLYAARITRDVERARDVVQDTFLRLLREDRDAIEPHLAEWLYTVCRNRAVDVRRKESRTTGLSDTAAEFAPAPYDAPLDALETVESGGTAMRYLAKLPVNQQEVIRLKFQHGLSYKEISGVTNLSVTNVGFLLHTGLKTLRRRMDS